MQQNQLKSLFRNPTLLFAVLVGVLVIWLRVRHFHIALERDEGEYAYAGEAILRGEFPYKDFYNMKMPITYYLYALAFWVGGVSYHAVKVMLLIYNALSAIFVFLIAQKLFQQENNNNIARLSVGTWGLLMITYGAQGWTANAEHFVVLPAMIGFYAVLLGRDTQTWKNNVFILLGGIFTGIAIATKQHAFIYGLLPIFYLFPKNIDNKSVLKIFLKYIFQLILYGIGAILPILCIGFYFYQNGIFERFYFLTIQYATAYIGSDTGYWGNLNNFVVIFRETVYFWILQIWVLYFITTNKNRFQQYKQLWILFLVGWLIVSPGGFFRSHYFQMAFPLWAMMMGFGFQKLMAWRDSWRFAPLWCLVAFVGVQHGYVLTQNSEEVTNRMYRDEYFNEMRQLGEKLPSLMSATGKIGLLCSEPEIAFYAHKKLASGYLYHYPLLENQRFAPQMAAEYIAEMQASPPEIFLFSTTINGIDPYPNIQAVLKTLETWRQSFVQNYEVIGKIYLWDKDHAELRLATEGGDLTNEAKTLMYIYKRKK